LFLEGLLLLIFAAMILLRLPHAAEVEGRRKIFLGSGLAKTAESSAKTSNTILTLGFTLITAAILLFLLSIWGIY